MRVAQFLLLAPALLVAAQSSDSSSASSDTSSSGSSTTSRSSTESSASSTQSSASAESSGDSSSADSSSGYVGGYVSTYTRTYGGAGATLLTDANGVIATITGGFAELASTIRDNRGELGTTMASIPLTTVTGTTTVANPGRVVGGGPVTLLTSAGGAIVATITGGFDELASTLRDNRGDLGTLISSVAETTLPASSGATPESGNAAPAAATAAPVLGAALGAGLLAVGLL